MLFLLGSYAVPTKNIIATLAVLLMQHGATASDCRTTVTDGWYHTCAILVSLHAQCREIFVTKRGALCKSHLSIRDM